MDSSPSSWLELKTMNYQLSPPKPHKFALRPFFSIVIFVLCIQIAGTEPISTSDFGSSYHRHCNDVVPRSPTDSDPFVLSGSVGFPSVLRTGYFTGGTPLLGEAIAEESSRFFFFNVYDGQRTVSNGVYQFKARLTLSSTPHNSSARHDLRLVRFRGPAVLRQRARLSFLLKGFWSESSQTLCMVGSSSSSSSNGDSLPVVLKLRYPRNLTVYSSLVTGSLESLDEGKFSPISLLALPLVSDYAYTLMEKESGNGCQDRGERALSLSEHGCSVLNRVARFELEYGEDCNGFDCSPLGSNSGFLPKNMFFYRSHCSEDKKWHFLLGFPNSSFSFSRFPFDPSTTLIAEGAWNEKDNLFCAVACRILNGSESLDKAFVGDCATRFSLSFPASLSLQNWSNVVGEIWNAGHLNKIGFKSFNEKVMDVLRVKYEYTSDETVVKTCSEKKTTVKGKGKVYPDEYSWDMTFDMSVRNSKGQVASGYSTPFYVGNQLYGNRFFGFRNFSPHVQVQQPNTSLKSPVNIAYKMSLTLPNDFELNHDSSSSGEAKISGEGTYDKSTGTLCMVGCLRLGPKSQPSLKNDTLDCKITISVQFSPLDTKTGKNIKGSIVSTRPKSDPLYFGHLELSSNSIYTEQAASSIWRMDFELTMVLISKTLTCVCVGLQLFYAKSHPDVLLFSSVAMLIVLTVGHMIPLLLNFEALFASHHKQNDFLGSGAWLEANEVIVRIVTMVAFLMQLRLLHLTWTSRQGHTSKKNLWNSELKVFFVTLPVYLIGAVISWYINRLKNSHTFSKTRFSNPHRMNYVVAQFKNRSFQKHSLWNDLKSYAGLVMDGFLLPQILFNIVLDSRERALAPSFYAGTTIVRLLPHAYDLYRAHAYSKYLDLSYIYASHRFDYYSTAWNIVILCAGILFAVLIFLQQQFGGRCFLPRRCKNGSEYEKVSVISNEDL